MFFNWGVSAASNSKRLVKSEAPLVLRQVFTKIAWVALDVHRRRVVRETMSRWNWGVHLKYRATSIVRRISVVVKLRWLSYSIWLRLRSSSIDHIFANSRPPFQCCEVLRTHEVFRMARWRPDRVSSLRYLSVAAQLMDWICIYQAVLVSNAEIFIHKRR